MTTSVRWFAAAVLLPAGLLGLPSPGRAADPTPERVPAWLEALAYADLPRYYAASKRLPEIGEMILAIAGGSRMGPGGGWFHPGQTRYGWAWLAKRHGIPLTGRITRKQFKGPPELFDRLDRNRDAVLTAADFDWSDRSPFVQQAQMASEVFYRLDADSNGRITRAEWEAFFKRAAKGKTYLTREDLREALSPSPQPQKKPAAKRKGPPMPVIFLRGLFQGELGSFREGPAVGGAAPDFGLTTHDGKRRVRLSEFRGKRPVVLVFGSFT
jgi:hypothetical protein